MAITGNDFVLEAERTRSREPSHRLPSRTSTAHQDHPLLSSEQRSHPGNAGASIGFGQLLAKALRNTRVRHRLMVGFGGLIALMLLAAVTGLNGITTLRAVLFTVGSEEAPLVDAANRMKLELMVGRNALEEFKGATAALNTANGDEAVSVWRACEASTESFDRLASAIVNGGHVDGITVIKTDNPELAKLVYTADRVHNEEFQAAATRLRAAGNRLLTARGIAEAARAATESAALTVVAAADAVEARLKAGTVDASGSPRAGAEQVALVDAAMELKVHILADQLVLEAVARSSTLAGLDRLAAEHGENVRGFDQYIRAILDGGDADGTVIRAVHDGEARRSIEELDGVHGVFQEAARRIFDAQRELITASGEAARAMVDLDAAGERAAQLLADVQAAAAGEMELAREQGERAGTQAADTLISVALAATLLGVGLGWIISRSISGPLGGEPAELAAIAGRIADGDLTYEFRRSGREGGVYGAMQEMTGRLRRLVDEIVSSSTRLASAAGETAAITEQTNSGIQQQQRETEQVAAAMNQMSATVQEVARNATETAGGSRSALESSARGSEVVKQTIEAIGEMASKVEETGQVVGSLKESSNSIEVVLEVIRGVAEQTNLLALNAAIEAARAGEQGRGFAVVADEVRTLAQRTRDSTEEIEGMIGRVRADAQQAVTAMESMRTHAQQTVVLAGDAGNALEAIAATVSSINDKNVQIASAAEEQSTVADGINRNIANISDVALQSAAGARETEAASMELARLAEKMRELVSQFRT